MPDWGRGPAEKIKTEYTTKDHIIINTRKSIELKASETTLILKFSVLGAFYLSEVKGFVCNIHIDVECHNCTQLLQKRILQAGLQPS